MSDVVWLVAAGAVFLGIVLLLVAVATVMRGLRGLQRAALRFQRHEAAAMALGERAQQVQTHADVVEERVDQTRVGIARIAARLRNRPGSRTSRLG